jgi:hypothetical protein
MIVLFILCNHLGLPTTNEKNYVHIRHMMRIWKIMKGSGIHVHVVSPYRPGTVHQDSDNPIYSETTDATFHSVDVMTSLIHKQYSVSVVDVWETIDGVQTCKPRIFTPAVHFLIDSLADAGRPVNVVVYEPAALDAYSMDVPLRRNSERWWVYGGGGGGTSCSPATSVHLPRVCFPDASPAVSKPPYIGQDLVFVINTTRLANMWWVKNAVTAVRLTIAPTATIVVLCDMPEGCMKQAVFPDGVRGVHCTDDEIKKEWYDKAFACLYMGHGEDDLAMLDAIGHGLPVIVNRNEHHMRLLGKHYPLYALRPDIQSIRAAVNRALENHKLYASAVDYVRGLCKKAYSNEHTSTCIAKMFGEGGTGGRTRDIVIASD